MSAAKFCKKPVEIEALRYVRYANDATNVDDVLDWIGAHDAEVHAYQAVGGLVIQTLEGDMLASPGDWIIRGVQGEFYPCKPDIFDATYEPVS